jgi:hypothetical protein
MGGRQRRMSALGRSELVSPQQRANDPLLPVAIPQTRHSGSDEQTSAKVGWMTMDAHVASSVPPFDPLPLRAVVSASRSRTFEDSSDRVPAPSCRSALFLPLCVAIFRDRRATNATSSILILHQVFRGTRWCPDFPTTGITASPRDRGTKWLAVRNCEDVRIPGRQAPPLQWLDRA